MLHFFAYLIEIFVTILVLLLNATEITDGRVRKFVVISSSVSLVISPLVLVKQLQAFIESFLLYFFLSQALFYWDILHRWTCLYEQLDCGIIMCFQLLQYVASPVSGHFDFTIPYFVVKGKQIRTIHCKDLSTSLLSSVLFAAELRFV